MKRILILLAAGLVLFACEKKEMAPFRVTDLQVDYMTTPLGIDAQAPRFSWKMQSEAMKKNPFQIDLTVEEYMRKILDKIGQKDFVLTEDDAALEFLNHLAKLNYASFEEQEINAK